LEVPPFFTLHFHSISLSLFFFDLSVFSLLLSSSKTVLGVPTAFLVKRSEVSVNFSNKTNPEFTREREQGIEKEGEVKLFSVEQRSWLGTEKEEEEETILQFLDEVAVKEMKKNSNKKRDSFSSSFGVHQ
jgi:hypothetical protein